MPYPLHAQFLQTVTRVYKKILVIEETYPVIEMQLADRRNTYGKMNGFVPQEGEITPDSINIIIHKFLKLPVQKQRESKPGGRRPSLCSGCPHRASFFAIKKAFPKAIYPGDIGCYTLGINFGAVDTCLCMGASINQAAGFYHSMKTTGSEEKPVVATIGDSTFIHSGITALINAVYNNARFVLVILDNSTTAMTGNQPTAATGILPDGTAGKNITLEKLLEGCGIRFLKIVDPYNVPDTIAVLKEADAFTRSADGGIAVVIARHPCLMSSKKLPSRRVTVSRQCTGCQYCITNFECPALSIENDMCTVKSDLCSGCGVCVHVCPVHAITIE
jgi:indolepyruvate ferredoxin oxidoreductase alpha subunit